MILNNNIIIIFNPLISTYPFNGLISTALKCCHLIGQVDIHNNKKCTHQGLKIWVFWGFFLGFKNIKVMKCH